MAIEDNMKIASGLRRMGIMAGEVAELEEMIMAGKSNKEIADRFACDESVPEAFRPAKGKAAEPAKPGAKPASRFVDDDDDDNYEDPRAKRK